MENTDDIEDGSPPPKGTLLVEFEEPIAHLVYQNSLDGTDDCKSISIDSLSL